MINEEIQKATNQDKTGLLKKEKTETGNHLTLCITYNQILPNIKAILEKHWHILNVNFELKKVFDNKPLLQAKKIKDKSCEQTTNLPMENVHHVFQTQGHFVVNR